MSRKVLLINLILAATLVAWQPAPVLLLTVSADPAAPVPGGELLLTYWVENASAQPLERVVVIARAPTGTTFRSAAASQEDWTVTVLPGGEVWYAAQVPLASGQKAAMTMSLTVQPDVAGDAVVVESYAAFATGMEERVSGEPLTLRFDGAPTPSPTMTPSVTASPEHTPTAGPPTATPPVSPTVSPTETLSPAPTPSPTITVVMAVLAPTPTPVLSSEQEQLGTLTVSIFVGITLLIAVIGAVWLIRWSRR